MGAALARWPSAKGPLEFQPGFCTAAGDRWRRISGSGHNLSRLRGDNWDYSVRFALMPAPVRGVVDAGVVWDPVPVLVAEGGEQKRCQKQNHKSNDYPWPKRVPRRLFGRTGTRRQANCCRGGGEIPSYKALGRISFSGDRLLFE